MSTSLAEQLQKLALPQTKQFLKDDKKRASLLFDAKEAASLTKEAVYQIGISGFEDLRAKSSVFDNFEKTLFSHSSKNFERSVQTAEANDALNRTIKAFFLALSPYLLMTSAQRTLEWLIYRYQVHEYNKDDFVLLILPYHETNIFVRALQIVHIQKNDKWLWLKPLQKPGIQLSKSVLFNQTANNLGFLKMISDHVTSATKLHDNPKDLAIIYNMYCVTFIGALEVAQEVNENLVTQMLPSILKGMKSDVENFCAAAYIILSHIFAKTCLTKSLLGKIVKKIVKVDTNVAAGSETIMILCILYQTNVDYDEMPEEAIGILATKKWFIPNVQQLMKADLKLVPLLRALLQSTIKFISTQEAGDEITQFFNDLLSKLKFDHETATFILRSLLDSYDFDAKYNATMKNWQKDVLDTIERQYPDVFDEQVKEIMKDDEESTKRALQSIMQHMACANRLQILDKLNHPSREVRSVGIKNLLQNFEVLGQRDREFLRHIIIYRLFDDDLGIVEEALQFSDKLHRAKVVTNEELSDALSLLLFKYPYHSICGPIIEKLSKICVDTDYRLFLAIFPYLFPTSEEDFQISKVLLKSYVIKSTILEEFKSYIDSKTWTTFAENNFDNLDKIKIDRAKLIDATDRLKEHIDKSAVYKYSVIMLFTRTRIEIDCLNDVERIIGLIDSTSLGRSKDIDFGSTKNINKLPYGGLVLSLTTLISRSNAIQLNQHDFHGNSINDQRCLKLFMFIFDIVFKKNKNACYATVIGQFLNHFASNNKIEFMLNVASAENPIITNPMRIRLIRSANEMLKTQVVDLSNNLIVPYLLICLQSEEMILRSVTMDLVDKLHENSSVLRAISQSRLEIISDHNQLPIALQNADKTISSLASLVQQNVPIYVKLGIINAFSVLDDYSIYTKFAEFATLILNKYEIHSVHTRIIQSVIEQFSETIAAQSDAQSNVLKFVTTCIGNDKVTIDDSCPSILMIKQITRELYDSCKDDIKIILLNAIIDISAKSSNTGLLPVANKIFKHIDLDALYISPVLEKMRDVLSPKLDESKRRRRISVVPTIDILDTIEWKRGVALLEFIQLKKKVRNVNALIGVLFGILKKCLDFDEQASVEYPKQLILSSILHYCDKLDEGSPLPEATFNVELVVQCIRASPNPQTHHHALLLLSKIATFIPHQVLLHIMAIFTFMGSSVLRHDDAYSFQIISKIIETIVPILVQDNSRNKIASVLRVFVDVILDVPEHRRLPLYTQLLHQIGIENLHLFLLLIFESHISCTNKSTGAENKRVDIACDLCQHFAPKDVLSNCIQMVDYLKLLPLDNEGPIADQPLIIFDLKQASPKQFRHYKYTIVWFMSKLLSSKNMVLKVMSLPKEEHEMLEDYYKKLIVGILTYIQATAKVTTEKYAKTNQAQYWKVFLHHCYDILDSLNALLTPEMFLLVIKGLTSHELPNIKRRALELLNSRLQHNPEFFAECDQSDLHSLVPSVILIIKKAEQDLDTEDEVIVQTALLSLKLFIRMLGDEQPEKFVKILNFIVELMKNKLHPNILASAILCLAELCTQLRSHSISVLNKFMPIILKVLKNEKHQDKASLLLISAITALQKILDVLALFMSPYLEKLLFEYSQLIAKFQMTYEKQEPVIVKLNSVKEKIGTTIPSRILIPAIENTYGNLCAKQGFNGIGPLMDILSECLNNISGPEVQQNMPDLTALFLNCLEFRCHYKIDLANTIEGHVIGALTKLVLKLSEASFRPLYYKLYDWAIRCDNENKEKVITFYALSSSIAASLKGLFVLFAGHFLNNVALVLDACNSTKNPDKELYFDSSENNELLLENALKTVNLVCAHDYQKFINKERFDVLMQPIVDQLDNTLGEQFENRVRDLVIPTIVSFTVATGDDALWKQMNYQIMLKMRDSNPLIRLLALECLRDVCQKVGEDFLPLLPETIPFLSELLEDEEESVEKACRKTIQELESVLGESLQKYF